MAARRILISVVVGAMVGGVAFFFAAPDFSSEAERYQTAAFLFPYGFLFLHLFPSGRLLLPLVFAQFPAYGLFYAWAWSRGREARGFGWIVATHLVLAASAKLLCHIDRYVNAGLYPF